MSYGSINPMNTNGPALDAIGTDPCPETKLAHNLKQLDCAVSELLTIRGELDLDHRDTQTAIQDFTLALQFNNQNERAMVGKTRAETRSSTDGGDPTSAFTPTTNRSPSPRVFRSDSGYRLIAIRPECNFEESQHVIYDFGNTPEQKRLAIYHAKQLARDPNERFKMELNDEVPDMYFSAAVQRVHSLIETVALIAPQDQLDSPRTPYLPATGSREQMLALPEPRGIWRCLVETTDEKCDSSLTKADELEGFIQSVESTVCTAVSETDVFELVEQFEKLRSFPTAFEKLFVACQSHGKPPVQDDLTRALLEDENQSFPVDGACHLSAALQSVQYSIYAATMEKTSTTLSQYPAHFRAAFELDLHAFIYETLLFAVSRHPSLKPSDTREAVSCA